MSRFLDVFRSFKPRRQENGLDFSYIPIGKGKRQKQLAAMCEPARSSWAVLRNSPSAVAEFLEHNHGQRYIIFNLTEHPHPRKTLESVHTMHPYTDVSSDPSSISIIHPSIVHHVFFRPPASLAVESSICQFQITTSLDCTKSWSFASKRTHS